MVTVHPQQGTQVINKEIYGQFAEHLGTCIYGGLWVGEDSSIPNVKGYRTDVLEALKILKFLYFAGRAVALLTNTIGWTVSDHAKTGRRW